MGRTVVLLPVEEITADPGIQPRVAIDEAVVGEYAEHPDDLPPVVVFGESDVGPYWLADGFHRLAAWQQVGRVEVPCHVHEGGRREATLFAAGSNATHGLRRSTADKRRSVELLLRDRQWSAWSDSEIGRRCQVDHKTVAAVRAAILGNSQDAPRLVERNGTTYAMQTAGIGPRPAGPAEPAGTPEVTSNTAPIEEMGGEPPDAEAADPTRELIEGCPAWAVLSPLQRKTFERDARIYFEMEGIKRQATAILQRARRGMEPGDPSPEYLVRLEQAYATPHPRDWKPVKPEVTDVYYRERGYIVP